MHLRTPGDIGALVRERRKALKLSQNALARKAGTSREWIVDLEKGKPRVPLSLVLRTLGALGIAIGTHEEEINHRNTPKKEGPGDIEQVLNRFRRKK